jgi:hypothetical protein
LASWDRSTSSFGDRLLAVVPVLWRGLSRVLP